MILYNTFLVVGWISNIDNVKNEKLFTLNEKTVHFALEKLSLLISENSRLVTADATPDRGLRISPSVNIKPWSKL